MIVVIFKNNLFVEFLFEGVVKFMLRFMVRCFKIMYIVS